jgi:hypothetical protein
LTPTPSPTFCYEPQAYLVLDAQTGSTALNSWMASQGSAFRGLWINPPSSTQSIFEAQMNAYISYTGFGTTTFYIEDEPIVSTTSLTHSPEQLFSGTNVWNTWFVPTCPFCEGGNWTTWNGATLTAAQYNKPFYYSGTAIPQGYYRWLTTYTFTNQRTSSDLEQTLDTLVCPSTPTPSPTNTMTQTPSVTQTMTQTPSVSPTSTATPELSPTQTPSQTSTQTNTPSMTSTPSQTGTPPVTPTSTINTTPSPTPSVTMTNSPTTTMTPTVTPTSAVTTCCVAEIRTDASLDITITGLEVSGVTMTYLSGDTLPIAPSDPPGYYGTFQTGTSVTVVVSYNPCIAGQKIILCDCDEICQCCDLNPGGGNCTFTGVNLSCGCQFTITGYDGTCT